VRYSVAAIFETAPRRPPQLGASVVGVPPALVKHDPEKWERFSEKIMLQQ
jgi:hypothetical protein